MGERKILVAVFANCSNFAAIVCFNTQRTSLSSDYDAIIAYPLHQRISKNIIEQTDTIFHHCYQCVSLCGLEHINENGRNENTARFKELNRSFPSIVAPGYYSNVSVLASLFASYDHHPAKH